MQMFFNSRSRPPRGSFHWWVPVAFLLLTPSSGLTRGAAAQNPYRPPQVYSQIIKIRDTLLAGDYLKARVRCDALEKAHPDLLAPSLGRLLSWHAQMFEQDSFNREKEIQAEFDHLLAVANAIGKQRPFVFEDFLFLGGAYGSMGLHVSLRDDYFEAFRLGMVGLYYISRGHDLEPGPADDQLAWGIFHYYRGYLAQTLSWLPFYANDIVQGLAEIRRAQAGIYTGPIAQLALVFVLGRGYQPERALPDSSELHRQFPQSPLIAIEYGRALLHNGRYPEAAAIFQDLRATVPQNLKLLYYLGWAHAYWAEMEGAANPAEHRQAAEEFLRAFLATQPDAVFSSYAHLLLGDLDRQAHNYTQAKLHYQLSLELNPKYDAAQQRLNRLKGSGL